VSEDVTKLTVEELLPYSKVWGKATEATVGSLPGSTSSLSRRS
jgi:hypothetical protein